MTFSQQDPIYKQVFNIVGCSCPLASAAARQGRHAPLPSELLTQPQCSWSIHGVRQNVRLFDVSHFLIWSNYRLSEWSDSAEELLLIPAATIMNSQLPQSFVSSVANFMSYPENLVHKTTYPAALRAERSRLDDIERKLFTTKAADINVPFRDLIVSGPSISPFASLESHAELVQHLTSAKSMMMASSRTGWATHQERSKREEHPTEIQYVVSCKYIASLI